MSATGMLHHSYPYQIGGLSAMPGVLLGIICAVMGALNLDPRNMNAVLPGFMLSMMWIFIMGVYLWKLEKAPEN